MALASGATKRAHLILLAQRQSGLRPMEAEFHLGDLGPLIRGLSEWGSKRARVALPPALVPATGRQFL